MTFKQRWIGEYRPTRVTLCFRYTSTYKRCHIQQLFDLGGIAIKLYCFTNVCSFYEYYDCLFLHYISNIFILFGVHLACLSITKLVRILLLAACCCYYY